MDKIVEVLKREQGSRTLTEYAAFLDISISTLSRIYSEERNVGIDVYTKIVARLPKKAADEIESYTKEKGKSV